MVFVSHSQNFEDVILNRVLNEIQNGFYIDIGAWLPDLDSVTKSFYDCGWNGINVEPNKNNCSKFEDARPRDKNLQLAVGNYDGLIKINFVSKPTFLEGGASGLSTLDSVIASQHLDNGWSVEEVEVPQIKLETLWSQYVENNQAVHFLKVDVEGAEYAVLESNNWTINRPWIVVFEATKPLTQESSSQECDKLLQENDYNLVYRDGLNHFYLAAEHERLKDKFQLPPNVFDNFVKNTELKAIVENERLIMKLQLIQENLENLELLVSQTLEKR